ncbi:hypothetical protein NO995_05300 [Aestuariibaculum sp. M13]|uniref:hypothetical protein n=1 Tax=Aestuariibaculum sp. M13 TaxID=2967132 RepID=UPI00215A07FD|nr:hypothetical protein [Aestuariibaculum sp. M13]MCR8667088.1 hypothetical protein [Aestuariibaculum sp. M13]
MKKIILILIVLIPMLSFSQVNRYSKVNLPKYNPITFEEMLSAYQISQRNYNKVSCSEVIKVLENSKLIKDQIKNYTLNSSWLKTVTKYTYENQNFVIIEVLENEYSYKTSKYIFCGIPTLNWINFKTGLSGTYGERFHKYIFKYKCDCE